jgi:UrcA family protein
MNIAIRRLFTPIVLGSALLASAPFATADETRPARPLDPAVTVHFGDLNPSTPAGVSALYARIEDAAQTVCGPSFSLWDSNAYRNWKKCYRTTIDHAVRQINLPQLTALHQTTAHPVQIASVGSAPAPIR